MIITQFGQLCIFITNATHALNVPSDFLQSAQKMFGQKGRLSSTFKVLQIIRHHKKSQNPQTFEHQGFSRDAQFFWAAIVFWTLKNPPRQFKFQNCPKYFWASWKNILLNIFKHQNISSSQILEQKWKFSNLYHLPEIMVKIAKKTFSGILHSVQFFGQHEKYSELSPSWIIFWG